MTPLQTARAVLKGGAIDADSLSRLAKAYLHERQTPRLKRTDFYAGRLAWGREDPEVREGALVCLTELREPEMWLEEVEGGYQFIYSTGGNGLRRVATVFSRIGEADTYIIAHHLGRDLDRYKFDVRQIAPLEDPQ